MSSFFRILLGLFLALYLLTIMFIGVNANKVLSHGNDFQAQYGAAVLLRQGKNVYDLKEEAAVQEQATGRKTTVAEVVPYINSPLALVWLLPLGYLPFAQAYVAWCGFLYILLLGLLAMLVKLYEQIAIKKHAPHGTALDEKGFFLVAVLVMHWTVVALFAGQFSLLLTCALCGSFLLIQKKQFVLGGLVLSILSAKIYLLFLPVLLLIYKKQWRILIGCVIGVAALTLVGYVIAGLGAMVTYSRLGSVLFWVGDDAMKIHLSRQITLRALLYAIFHTPTFTQTEAVLWILGVAATIAALAKIISSDRLIRAQEWAWMCAGLVLTGIHLHGHDGMILIIPLAVWFATSALSLYKRMALLVGMVLVLLPILFYAGFIVSLTIAALLVWYVVSFIHHEHIPSK